MGSVDVRIDGRALKALLEGEDGPVAAEIKRRTLQVERAAKRLAPVDTGRLRSSITHAMARDSRGLFGIIGTNVSYAPFVELGTRHAAAQPFLRPALLAVMRAAP